MSLADLLSQYFAADYENIGSVSGRRRPSGRSPPDSTWRDFRFEKQKQFSGFPAWNARFKRFINELYRASDSISDPSTAQPRRVAVDETAVKINGEWSWVYAAIDLETKLILHVTVFERHGTDPAAAFLHKVTAKHDCSNTVFLAVAFGYRTAFARLGLTGRVDYSE